MDALEAILTRRSIRKYTNQPVPEEMVTQLLEAAMAAPSASNNQPWHFVVTRDRATLDEIPNYCPYGQMLKEAQLAILVCGDSTLQPLEGYWVEDCSAATQNILLAAHALGLGAVWIGVHPREERVEPTRKLMKLPDHIHPVSLISIGFPGEQKPRSERFDPARVHEGKW